MSIRIHALIPTTDVNGPGKRFGIWLQGCSRKCPDCYNPDAQDAAGGYEMSIEYLYHKIISTQGIEGVSFSGGEPLEQAEALIELMTKIKENTSLTIIIFTAFTMPQLKEYPSLLRLADHIVLNAKQDKAHFNCFNRPSVCLSDQLPQDIELHILENGDIQITGFPSENDMELIDSLVSDQQIKEIER